MCETGAWVFYAEGHTCSIWERCRRFCNTSRFGAEMKQARPVPRLFSSVISLRTTMSSTRAPARARAVPAAPQGPCALVASPDRSTCRLMSCLTQPAQAATQAPGSRSMPEPWPPQPMRARVVTTQRPQEQVRWWRSPQAPVPPLPRKRPRVEAQGTQQVLDSSVWKPRRPDPFREPMPPKSEALKARPSKRPKPSSSAQELGKRSLARQPESSSRQSRKTPETLPAQMMLLLRSTWRCRGSPLAPDCWPPPGRELALPPPVPLLPSLASPTSRPRAPMTRPKRSLPVSQLHPAPAFSTLPAQTPSRPSSWVRPCSPPSQMRLVRPAQRPEPTSLWSPPPQLRLYSWQPPHPAAPSADSDSR